MNEDNNSENKITNKVSNRVINETELNIDDKFYFLDSICYKLGGHYE